MSYLKFSKIFVLSSVYEGLGNVLIDAINYDVPCVSTDCKSGPREILLNGKGGYLVKIRSPKLLAEKMDFCVGNYSLASKKKFNCQKIIKKIFDSQSVQKIF